MTKEQIDIYELCKKDLAQLQLWKTKLPFGNQNHGCGSRYANIFFELEKIHSKMHTTVSIAMDEAIKEIEDKISKL